MSSILSSAPTAPTVQLIVGAVQDFMNGNAPDKRRFLKALISLLRMSNVSENFILLSLDVFTFLRDDINKNKFLTPGELKMIEDLYALSVTFDELNTEQRSELNTYLREMYSNFACATSLETVLKQVFNLYDFFLIDFQEKYVFNENNYLYKIIIGDLTSPQGQGDGSVFVLRSQMKISNDQLLQVIGDYYVFLGCTELVYEEEGIKMLWPSTEEKCKVFFTNRTSTGSLVVTQAVKYYY